MNRIEYLDKLEHRLRAISKEDRAEALKFYSEYFEEAGPEREQEVIKELGAPTYLAAQITNRINAETPPSKKRINKWTLFWITILGILSSPITIPILFLVATAMIAFIAVIGFTVFLLSTCSIKIIFSGIGSIASSLLLLFTNLPSALLGLGCGLILFAGGGLLLLLMFIIIKFFVNTFIKMGNKFLNRKG